MMMGFSGILWLDILIYACIIIGIFLLYKLIIYLIGRAARTGKIPLDVVNGIKLLVRLITAIVIIVFIISFTQLPSEITLAISAVFGTVIGFASITAIQNFISGLYIIITRPFGINDLIAIGENEGIVTEISLNYTKLISTSGKRMLLSNRNVLNGTIINYTRTGKLKKKDEKSPSKILKHILSGKEITQYAFTLELPRDKPRLVKESLEEVAKEWEPKLGYKPVYMLWGLTKFAKYRIILPADNPETILKNRASFIKDLYRKIFSNK